MKSGIWTVWSAALVAAVALGCGADEEPTATADPTAGSDVAAAPPAAATTSPVERCKALAKEENWQAALEPCTRASVEAPSDLAIRHALQQARAAAEGS